MTSHPTPDARVAAAADILMYARCDDSAAGRFLANCKIADDAPEYPQSVQVRDGGVIHEPLHALLIAYPDACQIMATEEVLTAAEDLVAAACRSVYSAATAELATVRIEPEAWVDGINRLRSMRGLEPIRLFG